jgi:predicted AAA+ superfamily ATPase
LSFREFLLFEKGIKINAIDLNSILTNQVNVNLKNPLLHFKKYLERAYYPFYKEGDFEIRLEGVINAVLETDIPKYMDLKPSTIDKLKHLLQIIAESVPFKPNYVKISNMIGVSRNTLPDYFSLLEKAGLIMLLYDSTSGIRQLGKLQKVYLENTNLSYALSGKNVNVGSLRETFFMNQLKSKYKIQAADYGDFKVDNMTFEIGGKNKSQKQIKEIKNSFIVKDDIENGFGNIIPLWHFGFLY